LLHLRTVKQSIMHSWIEDSGADKDETALLPGD
jgi:hypothetical protein